MFERFTDRARRVLVLAQEEARLLHHSFIGTEHILLGLIDEGDGLGAKALESLEISPDAVRDMVVETIGPAGSASTGSPPFTPRAKKVLELSLREALQLGHNYIGTEHILLGLVREGQGVAAQVLQQLGASLPRVRQEVVQLMSGYKDRVAGRPEGVRPPPWCTQCGESLEGNLRVRAITATSAEQGTPTTFAIAYCGTCGAALESRAQDAPVGVLEGLQPVRLRPAMFVGSTSASGLHRLISEVVDNALNEAAQGFCTRIEVTLRADGGCRVADDGRGIPVDPHPSDPTRSTAEIVLSVLHAGGKFGSSQEKMFGGVGIAVVNALSSRFELEIDRDGSRHEMVFVDGGKPTGSLKVAGPTSRTGTTITFWPDATIFDEVEFMTDDVIAYLRAVSSTYDDVEIHFRDERQGPEQEITLGLGDAGLE